MAGAHARFGLTDVDRGWKGLLSEAKRLAQRKHSYAKAGVLGQAALEQHEGDDGQVLTNVQLAVIHEFGVPGRVPERSFIRAPFDKHRAEYQALLRTMLGSFLDRKVNVAQALGVVAMKMAFDMRAYVLDGAGVPPPNAPSTLRRKIAKGYWKKLSPEKLAAKIAEGTGPRPLVDTGQMVKTVTHEVVIAGGIVTEWSPPPGTKEGAAA